MVLEVLIVNRRFDEGQRKRENTMKAIGGFGAALDALNKGDKVWRENWNGRGMWLHLQRPDANSKMTLPYIYMKTADDQLVPWLASQTDMLSEDWFTDA